MCGIAGVIRFTGGADDTATVQRMMARLAHRGPDGEGLLREGGVTLGQRRLAILDLSDAARQPMTSASGRFVLVFNGEIYNYRELAASMGLGPADLRTRSDTEVLLRAWERWGGDALPRLVGQFAFAVLDRETGVTQLARDRFGEKPLFWHADAQRLVFGSSIEALFEEPATPRALDPGALVEYVTLRYVMAPRTVVGGVNKLMPGTLLRVDPDGTRTERPYFRPRFRPSPDRSARARAERAERFDALLRQACARCMVSDVPVGLLLSDGIDSQSILSALRLEGHDPHAYTFRLVGGEAQVEDVPGAAAETVAVTREEYVAGIDRMCALQTEPVGDVAALATFELIARGRARETVFLCGHGGDEILGGYRLSQDRFRLQALRRFGGLPWAWVRRGLDRRLFGDELLDRRLRAFLAAPPRLAPAAARYLMQRPVPTSELVRLYGGPLPGDERYLATIDRLYGECEPGATDLGRMQEVMIRTFLSEDILPFADACAMASSAELRMPYLDRDLVELVLTMPDDERVGTIPGSTNTKLPLRRWSRGRVSQRVRTRRKQPFAAGRVEEIFPRIEGVRDRVLGSAAIRRAFPGAEAWFEERAPDWPRRADGIVWSLLTLAVWADAVGAT